jgi:hypothetical protein
MKLTAELQLDATWGVELALAIGAGVVAADGRRTRLIRGASLIVAALLLAFVFAGVFRSATAGILSWPWFVIPLIALAAGLVGYVLLKALQYMKLGQGGSTPPEEVRVNGLPSEPSDHRLEEWTECRTTIGRLDSILADIRKYGFSLVTVLLTANALITTANPVTDRVAASSVVIVLVIVLFLMDRYWWVLLRRAAFRASELEKGLGIEISGLLGSVAKASHNTQAASFIYAIFVLVSCGVALVTVAPVGQSVGLWFMIGVTIIAVLAIVLLHSWIEARLPEEPTAQTSAAPPQQA